MSPVAVTPIMDDLRSALSDLLQHGSFFNGAIEFGVSLDGEEMEARLAQAAQRLFGDGPWTDVLTFDALVFRQGELWGVWVWGEDADRIVNRSFRGMVADQEVRVVFGPAVRSRSPVLTRRGKYRCQITAITPVLCRCSESEGNAQRLYTKPAGHTLEWTLSRSLCARLGLSFARKEVPVRILRSSTEPRTIQMGGKYGHFRGWVGEVTVETNAVGAWLLLAAARGPGLGGRTAFGFGRIHAVAEKS